jgi:hypothetical protein
MQYPEYAPDLERRQPIGGFLSIFGQLEFGVSGDNTKLSWSQYIAEQSRIYTQGNEQRFRKRLQRAPATQEVPALYQPLHASLKFLKNHNELVRLQQGLHRLAVDELRGWKSDPLASAGEYNRSAGRMAEITAIVLLTRYAHPWILVGPTLPHQENNGDTTPRHFDIALAIGESESEELYNLQVKKGCSGRCGKAPTYDYAHKYATSVQIVSGCCDLGIVTTQNGLVEGETAGLLIAEYDEVVSLSDIKRLDVLTDQLLFNITADLLPRGQVPPLFAQTA